MIQNISELEEEMVTVNSDLKNGIEILEEKRENLIQTMNEMKQIHGRSKHVTEYRQEKLAGLYWYG